MNQAMARPSSSYSLSSLLNQGSKLSSLFQKASKMSSENNNMIHEEVEKVINDLFQELDNSQGPYVEKSVPYVSTKIINILEEFIKLDLSNRVKYKEMVIKVKERSQSIVRSSSISVMPISSHVHENQPDFGSPRENIGNDFEAEYKSLGDPERKCLLWLSRFPSEEKFNKTEFIQWWDAINLVDDIENDINDILGLLTVKGFINRVTIKNKKFSNIYMIPSNVHSKVKEKAIHEIAVLVKQKSPCIIDTVDYEPVRDTKKEDIEALINISEHALSMKIFEEISRMKNLRILHLGSLKCNRNDDYIVLEKLKSLHDLKNLVEVKYLNLRGISGMTELPISIYKLKNLMFLILKACNSLELLPNGIEALQDLTYLDLSECYQLNHVPKEITSLSKLKVLKGFIINTNSSYNQQVEDQRGGLKYGMSSYLSCSYSDLSTLKNIKKLTLRTRRMNFPTIQDLCILCKMGHLNSLGISWVGTSSVDHVETPDIDDGGFGRFPITLEKLKFHMMPKRIGSRILGMIREGSNCRLWKLSIIGGQLEDLGPEEYQFGDVEIVHLRYLKQLKMEWYEFEHSFPNLIWVEILGCPNLESFPCNTNGVWEISQIDAKKMGVKKMHEKRNTS